MNYKVLTAKQEKLNRLMNLHFSSYFEDLPLTSTQALTLEYIIEKGKTDQVYQKDVEMFLSVRKSSVTSLIDNLERDGYIRRESVPFDGRYRHLAPTQKAMELKPVISERITQYMESLFVGIPDEDLEVFESVLDRMTENTK